MSGTQKTGRLRWGLERLGSVLLGSWIGAMLAVAFVAAPLVFGAVPEHLPTKEAAARVIGPAFARIDLLGVAACLVCLTALLRRPAAAARRWRLGLLCLFLVSTATDALYLAPAITARTEPLGLYHGTATSLWMFNLIAGGFLMWRGLVPAPRQA